MKSTDIIFFDNTDDYSKYDNAKQAVYESFCECQDWTSINDVPADMVWDEISLQNKADWEYFTGAFKRLLENTPCSLRAHAANGTARARAEILLTHGTTSALSSGISTR